MSQYSDIIIRFRVRQGQTSKSRVDNEIHPLLECDIEPDVRPFKWPRRKRRKGQTLEQPELFDEENDWLWTT